MKRIRIIALIAALAAVVLIYLFFNSMEKLGAGDTVKVITAVVEIPADTPITEEMILARDIPAEAILSGAKTEKASVLGKVPNTVLYPGEQIIEGKLIAPGETTANTLTYAIKPGMRAITISVDSTSGLSNMLRPTNMVDIIGEFDVQGVSTTNLVLENIMILAIDATMNKEGNPGEDGLVSYSTITLEVTPQQAMMMNKAVNAGQLRAVLRSPLDDILTKQPNITLDYVLAN